jgi:tRNA dimethylallyltransferase
MQSSGISNQSGSSEKQEGLLDLIVILGPTAVGKTEIAIKLAERTQGEIVSADSRIFYKYMDIGTAKPTAKQRQRVPHHLIDVVDPDQVWSLAIYQKEAHEAIREIHLREHLPYLVGGTGQYIRAVVEGWHIPKSEPNPLLRDVFQNICNDLGSEGLHGILEVLDPNSALKIDYRNTRRTIRALEVIFTTGKRFSDQRERGHIQHRSLMLGLIRPREELYKRIDERIDAMIEQGLVKEVQNLLNSGYSPDIPSLSAIGYQQIIAYLQGEMTLDEAISLMKRQTRIFVRRQANWFKIDDPNIQWFSVNKNTVSNMETVIRNWLTDK